MDQVMVYVGYITAILACFFLIVRLFQWIFQAKDKIAEPNKMQDEKIAEHEKHLQRIDEHLEILDDRQGIDYKRLNDIDRFIAITIKAQLALVGHAIDGNNIEELKDVRTEFAKQTSVVFTGIEKREREDTK